MDISYVVVRHISLKRKEAFRLSYRVDDKKEPLIIEIHDSEGRVGYGECNVIAGPWFNEETTGSALYLLKNFLIPALLKKKIVETPEKFFDETRWIRRNRMARASIDTALWNLYAKEQEKPEYELLGGTRKKIVGGISIGIQNTPEQLVEKIRGYLEKGYQRIKIKIRPGEDIQYVQRVRDVFGNIVLSCDANSAYTLQDIDRLKELDQYGLSMIEQPLGYDDLVEHAMLQKEIKTRICLDESINSIDDARRAISIGSCQVINIKVSRVGGLTEARRIQALAREHGIPVWCGSTFETGIGSGHNIAAATLPGYTEPNDIFSTETFFDEHNQVTPPVMVGPDGTVWVSEKVGTGIEPIPENLESHTLQKWKFAK